MQQDYDVEVEWRPFELHPEVPPEGLRLPPAVRERMGGMTERVKEMAQEVGLEMTTPDVLPNSRRALEAAEYAREQGRHEPFHTAVFDRLYGEGRDIGSWQVLRAVAEEAGLDPDEMQRETEAGRYRDEVEAQMAKARALGITGVPTYIFDERFAIVGAQPYHEFQRAMEEYVRAEEEGPPPDEVR